MSDATEWVRVSAARSVLRGWAQGLESETIGGSPTLPFTSAASRWSAVGAIKRAAYHYGGEHGLPPVEVSALEQDVLREIELDFGLGDLAEWNDRFDTRQDEVAAALAGGRQLHGATATATCELRGERYSSDLSLYCTACGWQTDSRYWGEEEAPRFKLTYAVYRLHHCYGAATDALVP